MRTWLAFDPDELRYEIAEVIANAVKSYNVPSTCVQLSTQEADFPKPQAHCPVAAQ